MIEELEKYIVSDRQSVKDALVALNRLSADALTLFVVDSNGRMVGTLTDGDIRRGLIGGVLLDSCVKEVMHTDFYYLQEGHIDVELVHKLKQKGIYLLPCLDEYRKIVMIYNLYLHKSILPIDAVLMAGGKGERLRPLTEKMPKPLLPVGEKPIIDYNIDSLIVYGIQHISVTVNYLKEQLEEHFQEKRKNIQVKCVREPQYLGTIGSVKFVDTFYHDVILVMNSDLFTNINLEDFYLHFMQNEADMSVASVPYSISIPYGIFELNGREILGVKEKPIYSYYANSGIYLIKKELLELIPDGEFFNATDFIEMLITKEKRVVRFPLVGYWIDIGKLEDYKKAQEIAKHL